MFWKPRVLLPAVLFLLAALVRAAGPELPTLLGERQYRSALIARYYYYEQAESIEPWRMHIAILNRQREGALEPPILERVVAFAYGVAGGVRLWIPRVLSTGFWLLGGLFLYRLALRFLPFEGAVIGTAFYLFNPLGVHASISFLPDPLMICLFALAILALVRFHENPSRARLWSAAAAIAAAVLVKPFCLFAIAGAVIALAIHRRAFTLRAFSVPSLVLLAAVLVPTVAYYGYGVLVKPHLAAPSGQVVPWDSLARSASVTFVPELVLTSAYWLGWARTVVGAMGGIPLIAALVGFPLLAHGRARALVTGLLGGYLVFCFVFTYNVPFAGHYHLQLAIPLAVCVGQLGGTVFEELRKAIRVIRVPALWALPVVAVALAATLGARAIRSKLTPRPMESPALAREIGERIEHSDRVAVVATYYGKPLQYFGEFYGTWWPSATGDYAFEELRDESRSIEERLAALGFEPEYFVITDFTGYARRHADLRTYLETRCALVAEEEAYRIYGECPPTSP